MKKNTRLLAVLLALGLLALSLTACAASSKYVAETTASVSNSAAYDSAPMEEPASTTPEFEEMKSENGALSMTTEVTQDDAPEAASTDVASKITRQTSPPRRPTLTRPSRSSTRRSQALAASSSARTSTATRATMTTAQQASSTAGHITPSASPPPALKSSSIRPRASETSPPSAGTPKT